MNQNTNKPQEIEQALTDLATGGSEADWEVFHDPATGQMRFVRRGSESAVPGSIPVQSIASTGFAAN